MGVVILIVILILICGDLFGPNDPGDGSNYGPATGPNTNFPGR